MFPVLDKKDMLPSHITTILLVNCNNIFKTPRKLYYREPYTNEKKTQIKPQFCKTNSFSLGSLITLSIFST